MSIHSHPVPVITFIIIVTLLGVASIIGITQQGQERLIEKRSTSPLPNEPVKLVAVKTKRGKVETGKKFLDDDDAWFKGLAIQVENTSEKNIAYINISISFERPDEAASEPPLVHSLIYGSRLLPTGNSAQPKPLAKGETVELILSDATYGKLKPVLTKLKYPSSIKHIQVYVSEVIFDDNTSWSAGRTFRRDPDDPEK
jgi:hypothetical protein